MTSLDFLGFTLRYDRDRLGRDRRYLKVGPSKRALARVREKWRGLTSASAKRSLGETITVVNTLLRGWSAYFRYGYPRGAFRAHQLPPAGTIRVFPAESEPTR